MAALHDPPSYRPLTHTQCPSHREAGIQGGKISLGLLSQISPLPLTAKGTQMRALMAKSLSFSICVMVRTIPLALKGCCIKPEQLF